MVVLTDGLESHVIRDPHVVIKKDSRFVYIQINGTEYMLSPQLARDSGEALYKAGCDVVQHGKAEKEK